MPVTIKARQFNGSTDDAINLAHWINSGGGRAYSGNILVIETLEGDHRASPGDWIIKAGRGDFTIKDVAGDFHPCKPDIFEATYSPA